ncbi:MAG: hypothetical protein J0H38_16105 [Rhizobiales bacterium]|nr:hypothetical protein [Hyphomicrobiales bacterium]
MYLTLIGWPNCRSRQHSDVNLTMASFEPPMFLAPFTVTPHLQIINHPGWISRVVGI